jgi:hypothetical protein
MTGEPTDALWPQRVRNAMIGAAIAFQVQLRDRYYTAPDVPTPEQHAAVRDCYHALLEAERAAEEGSGQWTDPLRCPSRPRFSPQ